MKRIALAIILAVAMATACFVVTDDVAGLDNGVGASGTVSGDSSEEESNGSGDTSDVTEPTDNYVMVNGISGFDNKKYSSFKALYDAVYASMNTQFSELEDIHGQGAIPVEKFKAFYTDFKEEGKNISATLTFTVHGSVVYNESDALKDGKQGYLITMGRASSHCSSGEYNLHLNNFVIQGDSDNQEDTLVLGSNITMPYEWWREGITSSIKIQGLTLTGSEGVTSFSIGQSNCERIDILFDDVKVNGISNGIYINTGYNYSLKNCRFDGQGKAGNFAVQLQGANGPYTETVGDKTYTIDDNYANVSMIGCTFSGYGRGVNIDQLDAVVSIKNCTFSNTDTGRSAIQASQCSKMTVEGCTINVVGNAFTLNDTLKSSLANGKVEVTIKGNTIKDASTGALGAHLLYSEIPNDANISNLSITFVGNTVDPTIDFEKGIKNSSESDVPEVILDDLTSMISFIVNGQSTESDTAGCGTVSVEELRALNGTTVSVKSDVLTIGNKEVTATASDGYAFSGWLGVPTGAVTSDLTITALFMKKDSDDRVEIDTDSAKIVIEKTEGTASIVSEITDTADVDQAIIETLDNIAEVKEASSSSSESTVVQVVVPVSSETGTLEISKDTVTKLKESGAELTVNNNGTTVSLDAAVIQTLEKESTTQSNATLSIVVTPDTTELTPAQKTVIGENKVVDVSAYLGKDKISDLGGKATVSVPYVTDKKVKVIYVMDNGKTEDVDCTYVDGVVSFITTHFSLYSVSEYEEIIIPDYDDDDYYPIVPVTPTSTSSGDDDTKTIVACVAAAVVAALMATFLVVDKKR